MPGRRLFPKGRPGIGLSASPCHPGSPAPGSGLDTNERTDPRIATRHHAHEPPREPHGELSLRARSPARAPPRRSRRRHRHHHSPSRGRRDARARRATQGPPAPNDSRRRRSRPGRPGRPLEEPAGQIAQQATPPAGSGDAVRLRVVAGPGDRHPRRGPRDRVDEDRCVATAIRGRDRSRRADPRFQAMTVIVCLGWCWWSGSMR
jgi:hypothetical protein